MTQWPKTRKSWSRLMTSWRLFLAEMLLEKAGDLFAKEGHADLALKAYVIAIKSARRDPTTGIPHATPPT